MISSAVAIPDHSPPELSPASSPLKRRPSSTFAAHTSKRLRLDSSQAADSVSLDYGPAESPDTAASPRRPRAQSPPRRKASVLTGAEEKKRGQRLFGALLCTLSQTSSRPASAQRRREDIEKRQIDRLKAQKEEREEERRRRREALAEKRKEEQARWDGECRRLRWANLRSMASFLQTTTEPRLYYCPWELRDEEKAQIRKQQEETERQIEREMAEQSGESPFAAVKPDEPSDAIATAKDQPDGLGPRPESVPEPRLEEAQDSPAKEKEAEKDDEQPDEPDEPEQEGEHHGEELVLGQEDDVIY
ncbi:hypothetical protein DV737_g2719, partial [Chaetothyriales sp. CBS 132003]